MSKSSKYICKICSGNCDPGELINGICHECRISKEISNVEYKKKYGKITKITYGHKEFIVK